MVNKLFGILLAFLLIGTSYILVPSKATVSEFEVAFSPGKAEETVLKYINSCQKTIRMATYDFTNANIGDAIFTAKNRGVDVKIVSDKRGNTRIDSQDYRLAAEGIPTKFNSHYSIHHHKFIICDGVSVQTGSFNYTNNAVKRNAENVLVVYNPEIAKAYNTEWERLFNESKDVLGD